jgi:hypothetical protein
MKPMNWIEAIRQWRRLSPEQQQQIRRQRLPRKVARSMAFEGEPVDQQMLEAELTRLTRQRANSTPPSGS